VLVLRHQQLLLRLYALDLAEVPSGKKLEFYSNLNWRQIA
jgi:hypothetical protein